MDQSISDILASVTRAHNEANISTNGTLLSNSSQQQQDLQLLTRAWISERVGPELLPYPTDLMDRVMRRIREQIETIEDRTARMDAGTSFSLVIIQTELERFKFLVRSYLRARIAKIDAHPQHIVSLYQSQPQDESLPLLSPQELQYLTTHAALLERHYNASFLSSFPPKLRRLDDRTGTGGVGMVEGPDLDKAVFVRCLGIPESGVTARADRRRFYDFDEDMHEDDDVADGDNSFGAVEVSCGFTSGGNDAQTQTPDDPSSSRPGRAPRITAERTIRMRRGDVWMVRWSSVRDAVTRGECELI